MNPLDTSSGDVLADRRADYAEMLFGSGDALRAAEVLLGALELAPSWAIGWFRLGEFHEAAGALDAALQAWQIAETLDPADRAGAALKLALAGAKTPPAPPSAFVETLFDQYAEKFDHALIKTLDYRVPELLLDSIVAQGSRRFGVAFDLGCGTGLMGQRLRPHCDRLEGYDISAEMLRKARAKNVYDRLQKADLQTFVHDGPKADLVTAADVFLYLGALDRLVEVVSGALATDGLFAFSVEHLQGDSDYLLQPSRRYAHSQTYVRRILSANKLAPISIEATTIRQDRRQPIEGLIVVATPA